MAQTPQHKDPVYDDDHEFPLTNEEHPASAPAIEELKRQEGISRGSSTAGGLWHGGSTSSTSAGGGGATNDTGSVGGGSTSSTQDSTPSSTSELADREVSPSLYNSSPTGGVKPRNVKTFFWGSKSRRRKTAAGGIAGLLVGGGFLGLTFLSGPLQFVHFAQLLQKWHLSANEDFGDSRGSKVMLYALSGKGVENTRLGIVGNKAANIWEQKLVDSTGLKPVYNSLSGRLVGFEIVDENKTFNSLLDASDRNDKTSANIERVMGKGAEITTAGDAGAGDLVSAGGGGKLDPATRIISVNGVKFGERARFVKSLGTLTDSSRVVSSLGSRLLIRRGGVNFHVLNDVKRKVDQKLADYQQQQRDDTAKAEETGTTTELLGENTATDSNGNPVQTTAEKTGTDSANSLINEAEASVGSDAIKQIAAKVGTGGALVGIVCAAQSLGNDITKYKYANDVLPMERMGMTAISIGNQVMSNKGFNIDELGAASQSLYDNSNNSSWVDARSIQAQMGQAQTGPDLPPEAQLKNADTKPKFFQLLDTVPLLSGVCSLSGIVSGLPVIGSIVNAGSGIVVDGLNVVAGAFGTSIQSITESALAAVSGKSVNTLARGAAYGGLADTGAFLAGIDNSVSMGGTPLTPTQSAALKTQQTIADQETTSGESLAQRYLDPYSNTSLVGSLINGVPPTSNVLPSAAADTASFFSSGFSKLLGDIIPKAHAATATPYDYGLPNYGFSLDDQQNPEFENPYDNASVIEQPGVLDTLNAEYGKPCFGMTVTDTATGVSVQTESMGSNDLNVFKVEQNPKCNPTTNSDPMFLRYRFYLADSVSAESLACYEADDAQSCSDLGFDSTSSATTQAGGSGSGATSTAAAGNAQQLAQQILSNKSIDLNYNPSVLQDIQDAANGQVGTAGVMTSAAILQLIATIGQSHSITITAIQSNGQGHCNNTPKSGCPNDPHYNGDAVDFGTLDGTLISGRNAPAITIMQQAFSILPSGSGFGQSQCGSQYTSNADLPNGDITFTDTCNHLHVQVPAGTP